MTSHTEDEINALISLLHHAIRDLQLDAVDRSDDIKLFRDDIDFLRQELAKLGSN